MLQFAISREPNVMPRKYLTESKLVGDKIAVAAKYPHRVKPVPASVILPYLEKQDVTFTRDYDVRRVYVGKEIREALIVDPFGGAISLLTLFNLSNVSRVTIRGDWYATPMNSILFDLEVEGSEFDLKPLFPAPVFASLELVFTYRDARVREQPIMKYIPYCPRVGNGEHDWICGVPTYSRVNSQNWKYVVASSISDQKYMRTMTFCAELLSEHVVDAKIVEGKLVEDDTVYQATAYSRCIKILQRAQFGPRVTVFPGIGKTSHPCMDYEVDKDYLETFADQVHDLDPKSNVIYNTKFNEPPGLRAALESESYQHADALYQRIQQLHQDIPSQASTLIQTGL